MRPLKSVPTRAPAPAGAGLLPALLFVSGAIALVYEVAWQRQFALVFGSAGPATAAVLAAYFAGLGAGAYVIGRLAPRWTRPLRAYAALELLIGVGALLVAPGLALVDSCYPVLFAQFAGHPAAFTTVRVVVAFCTLFIPTFCMGGTLPVVGALADRGQRQLGLSAGWLYVVNTAGAALGALAVPFLLLPRLGLNGAVWACAGLNALLALAAWRLDGGAAENRGPDQTARAPAAAPGRNESAPFPVLLPALVSGFVTFALQVLWNRAFAQIHENSMYSFAVIVVVVILALAVGAQLARFALRFGVAPARLLGNAWLAAGVAMLAAPWLFLRLTHGLAYLPEATSASPRARLAALAALVLLPSIVLLGTGLPALMQQAGRNAADASRVLGRLFAVNVTGSVIGALAAGFLLPRWLGLWDSLLALATLVLASGFWARRHSGPAAPGRGFTLGLALAWIASVALVAQIELPRVRLPADGGEQLLSLTEGAHGITAVVARGNDRRLKLNNHYRLGGSAAVGDERMQAHLPLLLHAAPKRVAFLGLGTGISAGGAMFHPVAHVTVMELVPDVVEAARTYFSAANAHVLDDPRTVVVADDARNHLRGSREKFDVIVGDLVVPWRAGEGALFTQEQFVAARAALQPGGIFCQWLPLFQLSPTQTDILIRTFLSVFPRAYVVRGDFSPTQPALALIGGNDDFRPDPAVVRARLAAMKPDDTNPQLQLPEVFWMSLVGVLEPADLAGGDARLNREDRPWVELLGPVSGEREGYFTGRPLQAWLDGIRARNRLAFLPAAERRAMEAGAALDEMTLAMQDGSEAGARTAQDRLQQLLPPESYRGLFP